MILLILLNTIGLKTVIIMPILQPIFLFIKFILLILWTLCFV